MAADPAPPVADQLRDAAELSAMGRGKSALALLRHVVSEHPDDATVRCHLALVLLRTGSPRRALKEADAAVAAGGQDAWAQHLRGAALLRTGQPAAACEALRQALAGAPDDAGVLCELATAECASGDPAAALVQVQRAAQVQPNSATGLNAVALSLLALERWPDAEAAARRALECYRGDVRASNNLALALLAQGNRQEAHRFIREALVHREVTRSAREVARNNTLMGGDDRRGGLRTAAESGQLRFTLFLFLFVVYAFLRSPWVVPVLVVVGAIALRSLVFRGAGGGRLRAPRLVALPAVARVTVALPARR